MDAERRRIPRLFLLFFLVMAAMSTSVSSQLFQNNSASRIHDYGRAVDYLIRRSAKDVPSRGRQLDGTWTLNEQPPRPIEDGSSKVGTQDPTDVDLAADHIARGNDRRVPVQRHWAKNADNGKLRTTSNDSDEPTVHRPPKPQSKPSRPAFNPTGW